MSNADVFGSPMILTGRKLVSPFGAAPRENFRDDRPAGLGQRLAKLICGMFVRRDEDRRIRKTVLELSRLDNHMLRDIGLNRAAIISAAHEAERKRQSTRRYHSC